MTRLLAIVAALAVASSCGDSSSERASDAAQVAVTRAAMQKIRLDQWPEIVARYRARVLVVDLWASWCVSCIERFPAMVALSEKYAADNVQFVSLNLDDPGDMEALEWSDKFLHKMQAAFPHYHLQENLMESFEALDLLAIPVVLIFDKSGAERYRLTGDDPNNQFGEDDVERAIIELLREA